MRPQPPFPELRHRGELSPEPAPEVLWDQLGGRPGVEALVADHYRRMSVDPLLQHLFPHFRPEFATPFFVQWLGGERSYSDTLDGGLVRRHQHRFISAPAASAWLRCLREALQAREIDSEPVLRALGPVVRAMTHSADTPPAELRRACDGIQDPAQLRLQTLLLDTARGRTESVRTALQEDPSLARRRGLEGQSLAWVAAYRGRAEILDLALAAGADPNAPGCDPLHATLACDDVRLGTGVAVTPLALVRKRHPRLVPTLLAAGALDDVFTAAWLGDREGLRADLDRNPALAHAPDPADDYQEVTLLVHALFSGSRECVELLLAHGAEVRRHSGKLLTLAVALNRADLVELLIRHGADVQRVSLLGPLDPEERPVADLLFAHGKRAEDWMLPRACRPDVSRNELHRVRVLLEYGASLDDHGRYEMTALHYAVRGGKLPLIAYLLERGANPNAHDEKGLTPLLHLARTRAKFEPVPVLELLLTRGADPNARDERGGTILRFYARQGNEAAVRYLLERGAHD